MNLGGLKMVIQLLKMIKAANISTSGQRNLPTLQP